MKAVVKYDAGPGNMEIREVLEPSPDKDQVKIKINWSGICGSDLHIYRSDIAIPVNPPVIVGHEFSGIISEIGEGVEGLEIGQRVVSETAYSFCEKCDYCSEGYYNLCNNRQTLGYWYNGIFAPYTLVPADRVHLLPDSISDIEAAMTEPLACVCHAIYDLTKIVPGDVVLVSGPGAIGIMAAQVAKAHGATVIMSGMKRDLPRLELAKELGVDITVNLEKEDLNKIIMDVTKKYGADVVLECSGSEAAINSALNLVKKRGYITLIGLPGKMVNLDVEKICMKEIKATGSLGSRKHSWRQALQLMENKLVNLEPLANVKLPLEEWEEAFSRFEAKDGTKFFLKP